MDRTVELPVVPPIALATTHKAAYAGLGLAGAATILGLLAGGVDAVNTIRLFLVLVGSITAGFAVSFRPERWQVWLLGAATALLCVFGLPAHWDSFRLLFTVLASIGLLRSGLLALSPGKRIALISAFILFHFGGILMAVTAPYPYPWLVDQLFRRVYEPYLQFAYLRNAYHFYSPEPGPAAIMACLIETEDGEEVGADGVKRKKYRREWVVTPRRPEHIKDPLGVTYFRRLSLTDGISHRDARNVEAFERTDILERRQKVTVPGHVPLIPLHPNEPNNQQFLLPDATIVRFVLPSYAQHMLMELPEKDRGKSTVKIYRLEHRTLSVGGFIGLNNNRLPGDPYYPTTYWPYFLGEFGFVHKDANDPNSPLEVRLLDPRAEMLYWLVPIVPKPGGAGLGDKNWKDFDDYLSVHAGLKFDWSKLR